MINPIAVVYPGNSTVHAGRVVGRYQSGSLKYAARCAASRANYDPYPVDGAAVTCKRCAAKLEKLHAANFPSMRPRA